MATKQIMAVDASAPSAELLELFPTPVLLETWPEGDPLNGELRQMVLDRMQKSRGVVQSNRGGWHSDDDLQTWPEAPAQAMVKRIVAATNEMVRRTIPNAREEHFQNWKITAWANVNRKGAYNKQHHHDGFGNILSGFYYVDTGETGDGKEVGGRTILQDHSGVPKEIVTDPDPFSREVHVTPKAGVMVMFPGRLYHHVERYSGAGLRITIAFNLKHPGFTVPYYDDMLDKGWWWTNFRGLMMIPVKIPEKMRALALLPRKFRSNGADSGQSLVGRMRAAFDEATAEASEHSDRYWGRVNPHIKD